MMTAHASGEGTGDVALLPLQAAAARLAQAVAAATGGEGVSAPLGDAAEYAAVFNNAEISAM